MSEITQTQFDYSMIQGPEADREFLRGKESAIKSRTAQTIIENGRDLLEAKQRVGHGHFLVWVEQDLSMELIRVKRLRGEEYHPCEILIDKVSLKNNGWSVYGLFDYRTGAPFYIGKTSELFKRLKQHCIVWGDRTPLDKRKRSINADGFPVLCEAFFQELSTFDADRHEQFLIDVFSKTIVNSQINKWKPQERKYA